GRIDIRHNHDPLTLTANSGLVGDGGSISITASDTSNAGTVEIGTGKGQIQIIATGQGFMSRPGNGGTLSVSTARDLNVDPAAINVNPLGPNGNGGTILL